MSIYDEVRAANDDYAANFGAKSASWPSLRRDTSRSHLYGRQARPGQATPVSARVTTHVIRNAGG